MKFMESVNDIRNILNPYTDEQIEEILTMVKLEEKKTLSDKIIDAQSPCCFVDDVKETIKELLDWIANEHNRIRLVPTRSIKEKIKEIFGERLI